MESSRDTIAALATPSGPARRGVVRVSGPAAAELVRATLRGCEFAAEDSRRLLAGSFDDGRGLQPVMVLWMRAPRSFTREDVAEFHLPGSPPLIACALQRLLSLGARAARAGEFTRRAFLNGRLDLSRVEGILAMTEAANAVEHRAAALLLSGGFEQRISALREALLSLASLCEASLDFDERETGHVPQAELRATLERARTHLDHARAFERARPSPVGLARVVLVGPPNAGKSTLWNALTRGRAIVGPLAGTTRDALHARWDLPGGACLLIDGPGLEPGVDRTTRKALELFEHTRRSADLVMWVVDGSRGSWGEVPEGAGLLVLTHADRGSCVESVPRGLRSVRVCAPEGSGLDELAARVANLLGMEGARAPESGAALSILSARNLEALERVHWALQEADNLLVAGPGLDLAAEAVRGALTALDELTARCTPEDVLERIFSRFCLGK